MDQDKKWDFFMCHAFQDAREIAKSLSAQRKGLSMRSKDCGM
jgi:hypothetical protein